MELTCIAKLTKSILVFKVKFKFPVAFLFLSTLSIFIEPLLTLNCRLGFFIKLIAVFKFNRELIFKRFLSAAPILKSFKVRVPEPYRVFKTSPRKLALRSTCFCEPLKASSLAEVSNIAFGKSLRLICALKDPFTGILLTSKGIVSNEPLKLSLESPLSKKFV